MEKCKPKYLLIRLLIIVSVKIFCHLGLDKMGSASSRLKLKEHKRLGTCSTISQEQHRCILAYETMELIFSSKRLEQFLVQHNWKPALTCKGWGEYHYHKPNTENVLLKRIRVPELIEDAPKKDILKLVRRVNRMAKQNILCAWVHRGSLNSSERLSSCGGSSGCNTSCSAQAT